MPGAARRKARGPVSRLARGVVDLIGEAYALAAVIAVCLIGLAFLVPRHLLPWTPFELDDPVTRLTPWKIAALANDPDRCKALLAQTGVEVVEARDIEDPDQPWCVVENAVGVSGPGMAMKFAVPAPPPPPPVVPVLGPDGLPLAVQPPPPPPPPPPPDDGAGEGLMLVSSTPAMRCPVALGFVLWKQRSLDPAAQEIVGSPIRFIQHNGTYACRKKRGTEVVAPSEHASANAIDIVGFEFEDGTRIKLPGGWEGQEGATPKSRRFLLAARDTACQWFKVVLGPEHNEYHADHFHLDAGPQTSCN